MMSRQYDNDTALRYVSTLLGVLREHGSRVSPDEALAGEKFLI